MMADEYIRRDDFIQYLEKCKKGAAVTNLVWAAIMAIERDVRDMPAADVAPVVHARWERVRSNWYCTGCHKGHRITNGAPTANNFAYCPNCGAKMDGGKDNG
jgi:rubredoxin